MARVEKMAGKDVSSRILDEVHRGVQVVVPAMSLAIVSVLYSHLMKGVNMAYGAVDDMFLYSI